MFKTSNKNCTKISGQKVNVTVLNIYFVGSVHTMFYHFWVFFVFSPLSSQFECNSSSAAANPSDDLEVM